MTSATQHQPSSERRRFPRKCIQMPVQFKSLWRGQISPPMEMVSKDISAGGLGALTFTPLRTDQKIMLTMVLPANQEGEAGRTVSISVYARVAWCNQIPGGHYRAGIQFLELDRYSGLQLKAFFQAIRLTGTDCPLYP